MKLSLLSLLCTMLCVSSDFLPNYALYFNGSSSVGEDDSLPPSKVHTTVYSIDSQYLDVRSREDFPDLGASSFTIELWVKTGRPQKPSWLDADADAVPDPPLVSNKNWQKVINPGFTLAMHGDGEHFVFNIGDGFDGVSLVSTGPRVTDNEWHHIAAVCDHEARELVVYQDCKEVGRASMETVQSVNSRYPLAIAQDGTSNYVFPFDGILDEIRIWTEARSKQDLCRWMNSRMPVNTPGLLSLFEMNEGRGYQTVDSRAQFLGKERYGALTNMEPELAWVLGPPQLGYTATETAALTLTATASPEGTETHSLSLTASGTLIPTQSMVSTPSSSPTWTLSSTDSVTGLATATTTQIQAPTASQTFTTSILATASASLQLTWTETSTRIVGTDSPLISTSPSLSKTLTATDNRETPTHHPTPTLSMIEVTATSSKTMSKDPFTSTPFSATLSRDPFTESMLATETLKETLTLSPDPSPTFTFFLEDGSECLLCRPGSGGCRTRSGACVCFHDAINGYWTGQDCMVCESGTSGRKCNDFTHRVRLRLSSDIRSWDEDASHRLTDLLRGELGINSSAPSEHPHVVILNGSYWDANYSTSTLVANESIPYHALMVDVAFVGLPKPELDTLVGKLTSSIKDDDPAFANGGIAGIGTVVDGSVVEWHYPTPDPDSKPIPEPSGIWELLPLEYLIPFLCGLLCLCCLLCIVFWGCFNRYCSKRSNKVDTIVVEEKNTWDKEVVIELPPCEVRIDPVDPHLIPYPGRHEKKLRAMCLKSIEDEETRTRMDLMMSRDNLICVDRRLEALDHECNEALKAIKAAESYERQILVLSTQLDGFNPLEGLDDETSVCPSDDGAWDPVRRRREREKRRIKEYVKQKLQDRDTKWKKRVAEIEDQKRETEEEIMALQKEGAMLKAADLERGAIAVKKEAEATQQIAALQMQMDAATKEAEALKEARRVELEKVTQERQTGEHMSRELTSQMQSSHQAEVDRLLAQLSERETRLSALQAEAVQATVKKEETEKYHAKEKERWAEALQKLERKLHKASQAFGTQYIAEMKAQYEDMYVALQVQFHDFKTTMDRSTAEKESCMLVQKKLEETTRDLEACVRERDDIKEEQASLEEILYKEREEKSVLLEKEAEHQKFNLQKAKEELTSALQAKQAARARAEEELAKLNAELVEERQSHIHSKKGTIALEIQWDAERTELQKKVEVMQREKVDFIQKVELLQQVEQSLVMERQRVVDLTAQGKVSDAEIVRLNADNEGYKAKMLIMSKELKQALDQVKLLDKHREMEAIMHEEDLIHERSIRITLEKEIEELRAQIEELMAALEASRHQEEEMEMSMLFQKQKLMEVERAKRLEEEMARQRQKQKEEEQRRKLMLSMNGHVSVEGCPFKNPEDCPFYKKKDISHSHEDWHQMLSLRF